ncbi:hypothetical protein Hanom_Chr06g00500831 [Helianthus anomalus]
MVQKPLSLLQDDLPQLGGDIFDELRVVIIKAETTDSPNATKVIFGVDPDEHNSKISSYAKSLVRDSFVSLVLHQSPLRLTESLFGEPSSFEVLKFVGGITVTPDQSAYPLQKVQIRFNFTLNFSIQQILDHFVELTSQLKSGLHLGPYEVIDNSFLVFFMKINTHMHRPVNEPNEHKRGYVRVRSLLHLTFTEHKHIIEHIFFVHVRSLRKCACSCSFMFVRLKPKQIVHERK